MRILHLTDFHHSNRKESNFRQTKIITKLIQFLKSVNASPDFILFTGDLVYSGDKVDNFNEAYDFLIKPIAEAFNIEMNNVFICPGNHDVNRDEVSMAIVDYLDKINDNKALDLLAKETNIDFKASLRPLQNYQMFIDDKFQDGDMDVTNFAGYSFHKRKLDNDVRLGVCCANTAWRAVGKGDRGNLLVPIKFISEGLNFLSDCNFRIILHHHPIHELKEFNRYELEDIIHNNFNISFSGHIHKDSASIFYTNSDGILKLEAAATLANKDGSTIGCNIIEVDLELDEVKGTTYKYDEKEEYFVKGKEFKADIPVSEEKNEQNKFRKRLRDIYEWELEDADDLFLNGKVNKQEKRFLDLYTDPVISSKSPEEVKKDSFVPLFDTSQFLRWGNHYLIIGDDKCGKTSLLKKIQLECLSTYSKNKIIPYYLDKSKISSSGDIKSFIHREFAKYFALNKRTTSRVLAEEKVLLLIDNLDVQLEQERFWLQDLIDSFGNCQLIISSKENSVTKYGNLTINKATVQSIYFHSLKHKQIRELAQKFYGDSEGKVEVIKRINHIFSMLAIPFNLWSVSLFMWVFKDSSKDITNDVDLVDLYIESILERETLLKNKGEFSFDKYKQYLANLAKYLLSKQGENYSSNINDIISFTERYLSENPRNNIESRAVWKYVLDKGLLKEVSPGMYAFRLNGIYEYFLAYYLKLDPDFRNEIIADENVYLSFSNELEMYAGSNRSDEEFVSKIFDKTKNIFSSIEEAQKYQNIDEALKEMGADTILLQLGKEEQTYIKNRISQDEVDELSDKFNSEIGPLKERHSEVRVKKPIPISEHDIFSLERALYVLGRVFKNADDIKNRHLINSIFDYLLDTTVWWGFRLFQTLKKGDDVDSNNADNMKMLVTLMKQMLPIIVQSRLYDMIGANNMQAIVKDKVKEILIDEKDIKQFKLFMLLFLLCDINLYDNIHLIKKHADRLTIPVLKYAILMKVLYYYQLKVIELPKDKQPKIEGDLQELYKLVGSKFNSKLYSNSNVDATFNKLDKKRIIDKGRL